MRARKPPTIPVDAIAVGKPIPIYLQVIHKHFEKAQPPTNGKAAELNAPLDLLEQFLPADLLHQIESITVNYKRKGA